MAFCRLLAVLVLIYNTEGLLGAEVGSSIIGGDDAKESSWPWMVHLNMTSDGINRWRCGGTILNSQWVMTAANCLDEHLKPDFHRSMVWIGVHKLQKAAVKYVGILNYVKHPDYQALSRGYKNNIALIKLKKKITFSNKVTAVSLPTVDDTFGSFSECWITGWGTIGNEVPLPDPETLQELKIPLVPDSVCKEQYPEVNSDMLCAGDMAGGRDACKGDYGGPLVCRARGGFKQVGIMSYGSPDGCALPGRPGVYTRVSKYLDFIKYYIQQSEEASAEV
ncbi:tryptase-2-like [Micropterus salmoides]|uniref:tryptase-2-like n=1 Tax=Micropterus salmoides TaxID=27706 RepID=UPI0018EDB630|nr:tryptase-2-like [Micropterus salmoides]